MLGMNKGPKRGPINKKKPPNQKRISERERDARRRVGDNSTLNSRESKERIPINNTIPNKGKSQSNSFITFFPSNDTLTVQNNQTDFYIKSLIKDSENVKVYPVVDVVVENDISTLITRVIKSLSAVKVKEVDDSMDDNDSIIKLSGGGRRRLKPSANNRI